MLLESIRIKGFRNFESSIINFNKDTLIIGPNDIGKTNLIYALRILLDRSLSQDDLTMKESDFNINNISNELSIVVCFNSFDKKDDEKIISKYGKFRNNDDGRLFIGYKAYRSNEEPYEFYIGDNWNIVDNPLCKIDGRGYTSSIFLAYLDSSRSLGNYLKTSKTRMINRYKNNRNPEVINNDKEILDNAKINYNTANMQLEQISYVKESAGFISSKIDHFGEGRNNVVLSTVDSFDEFEKKLELVSFVDGKKIEIGGDGRSNEIYLIMWIEEQLNYAREKRCAILFAIEEPENHLYFPLQSLVSKYIQQNLQNYQFIVSSHSPVVFNDFNPSSIIRLKYGSTNKTVVANNGCCKEIIEPFYTFGFRHNIMTNEMFFADSVLLVEGVSERLLYSAISKADNNILEKSNTRVIQVDGVGFSVYVKILKSLGIAFTIRTDNDFIPVKYGTGRKKTKYYLGGLLRLISIYEDFSLGNYIFDKDKFKNLTQKRIPKDLKSLFKDYVKELENVNLFLSKVDLEYDTYNSPLKETIDMFYNGKGINSNDIIDEMRKSKGNNMFELLQFIPDEKLKLIDKNTKLGRPLFNAIRMGEKHADVQ